jgi:hypothetical protein
MSSLYLLCWRMVEVYVVVGATGTLGRNVAATLSEDGKAVVKISATYLTSLGSSDFSIAIDALVKDISAAKQDAKRIGLVLAHRYRGEDVITALRNELIISHDLVWNLSKQVKELSVVVLGSVTGEMVDQKSPEAYHFSKDLQKSIVRQSVLLKNVAMNLIELAWFEKYSPKYASPDYKIQMQTLHTLLGEGNLPTLTDITDFLRQLMDCKLPTRGQTIKYDGGYGIYQK